MRKLKIDALPEILPVSPLSLACPYCKAEPDKDCETSSGGHAILHLKRIQAAAEKNNANRKSSR